jgi:hypothetical protein
MIENLPRLSPDAARSARTRALCHHRLARPHRPPLSRRFLIERAMLLGFGVLYLSSLAFHAVRILIR